MGIFGLGKKPKVVDRYEGKPFLKLVDAFVLDSIGELDSTQDQLLHELTPKFQETFKTDGDWREIVIAQLRFPPDIGNSILELWTKNREIAKQHGKELSPLEFVEMFVAQNITNVWLGQ